MYKKKLSVLLSLLLVLTMMQINLFANDFNIIMPEPITTSEIPCRITTDAGMKLIIEMPEQYNLGNAIYITLHGGKWTPTDYVSPGYYGYNQINYICRDARTTEQALGYDFELSNYSTCLQLLVHLKKNVRYIEIPLDFTVNEKKCEINVESMINGFESKQSPIVYYIPQQTNTQTTTPQAITNNTQNPYPSYNYSNTSSSTSNSDSSSSTSNTSSNSDSSTKSESKDEKKETTIKEESPLKNEETKTSYLSKEDINTPSEKVEYSNIAKDSEEYEMISDLSEKGIITQDGEVFDLKKELSKDESLTYLAKLLVVNDAASSKLDNEVIEKYLDPKDENFAFLATVGSMLEEDTLKTVSEAEEMSRELFAEILKEVTVLDVEDSELPFKDIEESPYKEALKYCYEAGLLVGTSKDTMSPSNTITNGQMLQVLSRLDDKLSKEEA